MESSYPNVSIHPRDIEGMAFIIAETGSLLEAGVSRQHSRTIGADPSSQVFSHPLVYSDDYTTPHGDKLYIYARHRVNQTQFLSTLDSFLETTESDFPEVTNRPFHCVLNIQGQLSEYEIPRPFSHRFKGRENQISFMRLYAPFGDISIDFSTEASVRSGELRFITKNLLPRKIEFPLFAFDASHSNVWAPFLTGVHWAVDLIPQDILEILIREAASIKVMV